MSKVTLYGFYCSSASWRVRIALALKEIPYEYHTIGLTPQEDGLANLDEYRKLNPAEVVPTLHIDGVYLNQSIPIIEFLNERFPQKPLLPEDAIGRAKVRALAEVINSGIQPLQVAAIAKRIGEEIHEWRKHFISRGFKALETMLQETSGKFCYKDELTMADLCLLPQVEVAKSFDVDVTPFPTITRITESLSQLPAFIAADPASQPDFPGN